MQINIYSFSKNMMFEPEIKEYLKRITIKTNIIKLKPGQSSNPLECKKEEAGIFLNKYKNIKNLIILDENGENFNSNNFAHWYSKQLSKTVSLDFLIGGAFGIDESVKQVANSQISLSKLTFPHKFVPLLLVEQIYRAISIINQHPYHKE
ncbi:MAG: 23S rRNA (pseudouridine(1915)-N(3))-methyltransferase RlmH [Rickettsiales bacterium]|nr:23S rRNA (pseudouridine(1915)-N(3))-methyltransferase RlmH [Rickettsiales bacterium]